MRSAEKIRAEIEKLKSEQWLYRHRMAHIPLKMREAKDRRADTILKKEWLDAEPHPPIIVFDDRDSVVAMWRENGIVCAQVAKGDF